MNALPEQALGQQKPPASAARSRSRIESTTGLRRRVLVMFAVALALIVLLAASVFIAGRRYHSEQGWLIHTYQVRERILGVAAHLQRAEMEARNYGLAGGDAGFTDYWHAIGAVEHDLEALETLVADNPEQLAEARRLRAAIDARRGRGEQALARNSHRLEQALGEAEGADATVRPCRTRPNCCRTAATSTRPST